MISIYLPSLFDPLPGVSSCNDLRQRELRELRGLRERRRSSTPPAQAKGHRKLSHSRNGNNSWEYTGNIYIYTYIYIPGKHWGLYFQVRSGKVDFLIGGLKRIYNGNIRGIIH